MNDMLSIGQEVQVARIHREWLAADEVSNHGSLICQSNIAVRAILTYTKFKMFVSGCVEKHLKQEDMVSKGHH